MELLLNSLPLLETLTQEINETCSFEDLKSLDQTKHKLKNQLEELMRSLQQQVEVLQGNTSTKDALQGDVARCLDWLQQTKAMLEEVKPIGLDVIEAQQALDEHKVGTDKNVFLNQFLHAQQLR